MGNLSDYLQASSNHYQFKYCQLATLPRTGAKKYSVGHKSVLLHEQK